MKDLGLVNHGDWTDGPFTCSRQEDDDDNCIIVIEEPRSEDEFSPYHIHT